MANTARDKLFTRLERKRVPLDAAREVAFGIYPDLDSLYPLRPVVGNTQAATKLVSSFGFNRSKIEPLWQVLWRMSTDAYYTPDPALPAIGEDEEVLNFPRIMPPYANACWASRSGMVSNADKCRGSGKPPLFPKTHEVMRVPSGVWVCWDCFRRQTDQPDLGYLEKFNRGELELVVPVRAPFRAERLSVLHGR